MDVLYGLHPVEEALRAGARQIDHVSVARERKDPRLERVLELCRAAGVSVHTEPREQLTRLAKTDTHQGVVAFLRRRELLTLEDLLEAPVGPSGYRFLLALDGVEDPHNLGALLRSADGAGIDGVVLTDVYKRQIQRRPPARRARPWPLTCSATWAWSLRPQSPARQCMARSRSTPTRQTRRP